MKRCECKLEHGPEHRCIQASYLVERGRQHIAVCNNCVLPEDEQLVNANELTMADAVKVAAMVRAE